MGYKIFLLVTLLVQLLNFCVSQPPYQVTIRLNSTLNKYKNEILCAGVIVQERIILTTADCMNVKYLGSITSHILDPVAISVHAGNKNGYKTSVVRAVKSIDIAPGYNAITLENDLAVLRLNESLPLGKDIQWIMIDDQSPMNQSCSATFANNLVPDVYSQPITRLIVVENQTVCYRLGNYSVLKRRDICGIYVVNPGVMCNATGADLRQTADRGTPLICNNKVIGLLSSVIAPSSTAGYYINCLQPKFYHAYYSRLASHFNWIYEKIALETVNQKPNIISPPYVGTPPPLTSTHSPTHLNKKNNANRFGTEFTVTTLVFFSLTCILLH